MALLDNARVTKSNMILREYLPVLHTLNQQITPQHIASQHTVDIPCVEVQIPEQDWKQIQQLIQAHERSINHPAVQDAWYQYMTVLQLTRVNSLP